MSEALKLPTHYIEDPRRTWAEAKLAEVAPALADVPEQVNRFIWSVQCMLTAASPIEAARLAREVAREAETVALLSASRRRLIEDLCNRRAVETMSETVKTGAAR